MIPHNRTCETAKIQELFCTCDGIVEIERDVYWNKLFKPHAINLSKKLDAIISNESCTKINFDSIESASYILPEGNETFSTIEKASLIINTKPAGIKFKANYTRLKSIGKYLPNGWILNDSSRFGDEKFKKLLNEKVCAFVNNITEPTVILI